ncbi:MAG: DUF1987 domain-containing protein [Crocinitomicaceae bacterium]|nr:DUF1987 domain-containing protein [Crocinitomicaceae bacterium]
MYTLEATNKTPNIQLDETNCIIRFVGRSIHEDPKGFYSNLFEKCRSVLETNPTEFKIVFELAYFNSSSAIVFRDLIRMFNASSATVSVDWCYEDDDDEMRGSGEEFNHLFDDIQFDFVVIS